MITGMFIIKIISWIILAVCLYTDLRTRKILNIITFPAMLIGVLLNTLFYPDGHLTGLLFSLKGLGIGLGIFLPFFIFGWIGGGDIKLLGVIGAFAGFDCALWTAVYSSFYGSAISLIIMFSSKTNLQIVGRFLKNSLIGIFLKSGLPPLEEKNKSARQFAYSIAIVLGYFTYLLLH